MNPLIATIIFIASVFLIFLIFTLWGSKNPSKTKKYKHFEREFLPLLTSCEEFKQRYKI